MHSFRINENSMIHHSGISTKQAVLYYFCNFICCACMYIEKDQSLYFKRVASINISSAILCNQNISSTYLLLHTHWSRQGKKDTMPQFLRITA